MQLKTNVELALFFLKQGGSFCLVGKHLRNEKVGLLAVEISPKNFNHIGKNSRDEDDIFDLAVKIKSW